MLSSFEQDLESNKELIELTRNYPVINIYVRDNGHSHVLHHLPTHSPPPPFIPRSSSSSYSFSSTSSPPHAHLVQNVQYKSSFIIVHFRSSIFFSKNLYNFFIYFRFTIFSKNLYNFFVYFRFAIFFLKIFHLFLLQFFFQYL